MEHSTFVVNGEWIYCSDGESKEDIGYKNDNRIKVCEKKRKAYRHALFPPIIADQFREGSGIFIPWLHDSIAETGLDLFGIGNNDNEIT
ncbi:Hypothetical protein J6896_01408 [Nakaseomyces glabratus]